MWISLSYSRFNAAIYVAGEVHDAAVVVPRAMVVGTLMVTAVYLALNAVFVYAPAPEAIVGQHDVATRAAVALGRLIRRSIPDAEKQGVSRRFAFWPDVLHVAANGRVVLDLVDARLSSSVYAL
jgi:amino acid transporter